jgi:hypothetical protein
MVTQAQTQTDDRDTVVVYDIMRESANRLIARLLKQSVDEGGTKPHAAVLDEIRAVREEVGLVPTRDYDAIKAAAESFRRRRLAA